MSDIIRTQLSGKFSKKDKGIFRLRKKLIEAGIDVQFPFSDRIVGEHKGIPVTFIPNEERSFYDIEMAFFGAIRENPIHIVHNKFVRKKGYMGESASTETAYAILHGKPIILLHKPVFSESVPPPIKSLIQANRGKFFIKRIDLLAKGKLLAYVSEAISRFISPYELCDVATEIAAMHSIASLLESYKNQ